MGAIALIGHRLSRHNNRIVPGRSCSYALRCDRWLRANRYHGFLGTSALTLRCPDQDLRRTPVPSTIRVGAGAGQPTAKTHNRHRVSCWLRTLLKMTDLNEM